MAGARETDGNGKIVIGALFSDYPFPGFLDPVRRRAEEFERAHPRYRIELTCRHYEELPAEVARVTDEGRPPALATYYTGAARQALDTRTRDGRPLFTSVDKAIGGRTHILGEPVVDDYVDAARGFLTLEGDFGSAPLGLSTMVLYTNVTLMHAAGVARIPRTWRELEAACAAVRRMRGGPAHAVTWPVDGKLFQQAITQQGGRLVDQDNGRSGRATTVHLTSPETMAYVRWWRRLADAGHYLYTGVLEDWPGNAVAFAEQRVAFRFGSSFEADFVVQAGREAGFEAEASPMPHNDDVPPTGNWIGGDSIWLADGLDEETRDGALAFIQYLNNPHNVAEWHRASGSAPVTRGCVELLEKEGWYAANPHHAAAGHQLAVVDAPRMTHAPVLPGSHGMQLAIMQAMEDVLTRGADPLPRFTAAQAEAQAALEDYNAICLGPTPRDPRWLRVGT